MTPQTTRIAIRADASAAIGTGHVRRMLSLAKALTDAGAEVVFVTRDLGMDSAAMIARDGFAANGVARAGCVRPEFAELARSRDPAFRLERSDAGSRYR